MKSSNGSKKTQVVLYTRVSTDEQAQHGYSLRAQETQLRQYCRQHNYVVEAHFQDDASAKTFKRPQFQAMLAFLEGNKGAIDYILVPRWDRFSRNMQGAFAMRAKLREMGVNVKAITQEIDESVPESILMEAIYFAIPEAENRRRALATKVGMRRAKLEGRWVGTSPRGYTYHRPPGQKSRLILDDNARHVREAFTEVAKGIYTLEEVRLSLRKKGLKMTKTAFSGMLRNPVYVGKIKVEATDREPERLVDGLHQPIITPSLFEQVQDVLDGRKARRKGISSSRHDELPLRGFLLCPECGEKMTGSRSKSRSGKYYWYYHCQRGCKCRYPAPDVNTTFRKYLNEFRVPTEVAKLYLAVVEDVFNEHEDNRLARLATLRTEIDQVEVDLTNLDERFFRGDFDQAAYKRLRAKFDEQKVRLEHDHAELHDLETDHERYIRYGVSLLADLPSYYSSASLPVKQKLIGLIFPENLTYEEGEYRTTKTNEVLSMLMQKKQELRRNKKWTDRRHVANQSTRVGSTGFEPVTSTMST
ncbi:MAG: recombinase family protein [Rhodothermales bacterium]